MKKYLGLIATTLILFGGIQNSFAAEIESGEVVQDLPRFSVDGGLGINLFLPYAHARLAYRLPVADNRLEINLSHSISVTIGAGLPHTTMLGAHYYFGGNPSRFDNLQPFLTFAAGATYLPSQARNTDPGMNSNKNFMFIGPNVQAGIGLDLNITRNISLSGSANLAYPFIFRPEAGLKIRF